MKQDQLIPHLFRTEAARITSVLCRLFGMSDVQLAEDLTSETFLAALHTWPYKGVPGNPQAWLYAVAKNKARNALRRNQLYEQKIGPAVVASAQSVYEPDLDMSEGNITDSLLQMLFAVCHPAIKPEGQIALALRILCGFGIEEIAHAFMSNKETINKRLLRAKDKLKTVQANLAFPAPAALNARLQPVLTTLYLLFNEGYYSETVDQVLRKELCFEAMQLTQLLLDCKQTNRPEVRALFALMCFHASRFEARADANGRMILYAEQDERLWDTELIARGAFYLNQAATGTWISRYHLEAGIAYWHTIKADTTEKWENILHLYNHLLRLCYSPVAALNRTFALSKVHGKAAAVVEAEKLNLTGNPYYHTLLGELYRDADRDKALEHFRLALAAAGTGAERQAIRLNMETL